MAHSSRLLLFLLTVQTVSCEDYLIALAKTDRTAFIVATTGREEGLVSYKLADFDESKTLPLIPFSRQQITVDQHSLVSPGIENKSLIISAGDAVSISGCYRYAAFAPLPISALGSRYILPFCGVGNRESVLVIASYNKETEVSITLKLGSGKIEYDGKEYKDGDKVTQHLKPFQTFSFTFENDVTGSIVETDVPVAVFLGSLYSKEIDTYDQLLPVSQYGDEYVVALEDDRENHVLQITSEYNDTQIRFNDGGLLEGPVHAKAFRNNETFYFNSSRPVMASICRRSRSVYYSSFVVVPPVKSYLRKKVAFYIPYSNVITSVKMITKKSTDVKIQRYTEDHSPSSWSEVDGTDYKVGTCKISNKFSTSFSANDSFTVLAFSYYFVQNGGYGLPPEKMTTKPATSPPTTTLKSTQAKATGGGSTVKSPRAEELSQNARISSPVMLVALICGLVIVMLVIIIATLVVRMRRRRGESEEGSPPGTPQLRTVMLRSTDGYE